VKKLIELLIQRRNMKRSKKMKKNLAARVSDYEKMIAKNPEQYKGHRRPGSNKK
jgi:hypothetical protein